MIPSSGAGARLGRLLQLVPWLLARPGIPLIAAATHFEITVEQLVSDLDLLICSGPGQAHGELLDIVYWDDSTVTVQDPLSLTRPLRLTGEEAAALLIGLRLLAQVPGTHDRGTLARVTADLEAAAGEAATAGATVNIAVQSDADPAVVSAVETAVRDQRAIWIRYAGAARDQASERVVDPMTILTVDGRPYLSGWCRSAEATRTFRLDRVLTAKVLDQPAMVPPDAVPTQLGRDGLRPEGPPATLELTQGARWVADEYPVDEVVDLPDGGLRVTLPVSDPRWLIRLVLRLGPSAKVISPPDLAEQVVAEAVLALAEYDQ